MKCEVCKLDRPRREMKTCGRDIMTEKFSESKLRNAWMRHHLTGTYEKDRRSRCCFDEKEIDELIEQARKETLEEVEKVIQLCGQVSGRAIRDNVNSLGQEHYINIDELDARIEALKKKELME
jgi:hypothetical protein